MINWKVRGKLGENHENGKQIARSAENLGVFKENGKENWRCMTEMTRILQK